MAGFGELVVDKGDMDIKLVGPTVTLVPIRIGARRAGGVTWQMTSIRERVN